MSELMLEAVLRMPPNLWRDDPIDVKQRHSRYVQAADELTTLRTQLAASKAREMKLRTALEFAHDLISRQDNYAYGITDALALPTDTTALREVCLRVAEAVRTYDVKHKCKFERVGFLEAIVDSVLEGKS